MLLRHLQGVRSLALIGMGKNVGKTTALNHLVSECTEIRLGLTSIGRDGEVVDAISNHPKPPIRVVPGTVVATVEGALPEKARAFQILQRTPLRTALGNVVIARALTETQWELSGPAKGSELLQVKQWFTEYGVELAVFDGAFDRRSSATPTLTDATLLVSGAALDPDMQVTLAETRHRVHLFQLPAYPDLPAAALALLERRHVGLLRKDGEVTTVFQGSALGAEEAIARAVDSSVQAVLVGSALTPQLLAALPPCTVVVHDGTHALVQALDLKRFRGELYSARPIHLPCLVANPYSPYGWRYDPQAFLDALAEAVPLPVIDVVWGECRGLEVRQ